MKMNFWWPSPILLLLLIIIEKNGVSSCSDFLLNTTNVKDSSSVAISARTMDFTMDLKTSIEVIPQGTTFEEAPVFGCPDCPNYSWNSTLGFVALNPDGENFPVDGLNEAGLSAAWLYLTSSEYPTPSHNTPSALPIITNLCAYVLGNFASVEEVKVGIKAVQIGEIDGRVFTFLTGIPGGPAHFPLHLIVHDAAGKSLVIEFTSKTVNVYDNPLGVTTNSPNLPWMLTNVEVWKDSSARSIPGDYSSVSRFMRLVILNHFVETPYVYNTSFAAVSSNTQSYIARAFRLLNTVSRPPGIIDGVLDTEHLFTGTTQWQLVRDHKDLSLYFKNTQNEVVRSIDLKSIDFTKKSSRAAIPVTFGPWTLDVTSFLTESKVTTGDLPPRLILEHAMMQGGGEIPQVPTTTATAAIATATPSPSTSYYTFPIGLLVGVGLTLFVQMMGFGRQRSSNTTAYSPI